MTLADRIAVFMDGRIAQVGTPREVFARPQTMAVAAFVGTPQMNLLPATWTGGSVSVLGATFPLRQNPAAAREVMLGLRPSDLHIAPAGLAARIERVEDLGDSAIVSLRAGGHPLKIKTNAPPAAGEGSEIALSFSPEVAHLFDARDGTRL